MHRSRLRRRWGPCAQGGTTDAQHDLNWLGLVLVLGGPLVPVPVPELAMFTSTSTPWMDPDHGPDGTSQIEDFGSFFFVIDHGSLIFQILSLEDRRPTDLGSCAQGTRTGPNRIYMILRRYSSVFVPRHVIHTGSMNFDHYSVVLSYYFSVIFFCLLDVQCP